MNFVFHSVVFYDDSVNFYRINDNEKPEIEELLINKIWAFVELDDNEVNNLVLPNNDMIGYRLVIYRDATARYEAFGQTIQNEDFWTDVFSLDEIVGQINEGANN